MVERVTPLRRQALLPWVRERHNDAQTGPPPMVYPWVERCTEVYPWVERCTLVYMPG